MTYTVTKDDCIDHFAIMSAGLNAKKLQRAYYFEREDYTLVAILDDQIKYGEDVLTKLEASFKLPSRSELQARVKREDIPPTESGK